MLALAALAVSWGSIPLIVREDVPWQSLVTARVWLGAATMLLIMAAKRRLVLPATHRWHIVAATQTRAHDFAPPLNAQTAPRRCGGRWNE